MVVPNGHVLIELFLVGFRGPSLIGLVEGELSQSENGLEVNSGPFSLWDAVIATPA